MDLKEGQRGFIFSLDATLAILVSLIALAGVASVGSSSTAYEQHGQLRLHRTVEDTLTVLSLSGTFDNALQAIDLANYDKAERILRENLKKALPDYIQFKATIGTQLTVYPTDDEGWEGIYDNARSRTASSLLSSVPAEENFFRLLTWAPETREEQFIDNIGEMRPLWYIKKTTNEGNLRENVQKEDQNGIQYEFYDAVFIPDADIQFNDDTIRELKNYSERGRLIVGGDTLYYNQDTLDFYRTFGLVNDDSGSEISREDEDSSYYYGGQYRDLDTYIRPAPFEPEKINHPIIADFAVMQKLRYEGDYIYYYEDFSDTGSYNDFDTNNATVLTLWGWYPEAHEWSTPWCGTIINDVTGSGDPTGDKTAIFINANLVQNVMDKNVDSYEWYMFTINAISGVGGYPYSQKPIKLSLWRGEGI